MRFALATILIVLTATGCSMMSPGDKTAQNAQPGSGILSRMRPHASQETVEELKAAEAKAREEQIKLAQAAAKQQQQQGVGLNGLGRVLPPVSTDPIAPPADSVAQDGPLVNNYTPSAGAANAAQSNDKSGSKFDSKSLSPAKDAMLPAGTPTVEAATYSQNYTSTSVPPPPPGAVAGGQLVPPPPAVTLSTNANIAYGGGQDNPYANPYLNPYAVPYQPYPQYPQYMMPPPPQQVPQEPQRPQGLFGSGKKKQHLEDNSSDSDDDEAKPEKKQANDFVPIRPVGMEARSPYKQKDDLKILWNGALNTNQMQRAIGKDGDLEAALKRMDVGLPPDASKGMFTVPPRRVQSIFRPIVSDKRAVDAISKIQFELVQAYYRYLYAYHKYALQQQTVLARKQEIEVSTSNAEKQRAEADLARAQDSAQSATEDLHSAQEELAAVGGAQAARSIIARVSGITPSIQSLQQAEKSAEPIEVDSKSGTGGVFGFRKIFFGGGKKNNAPQSQPADDAFKVDASAQKVAKEKGSSLFGRGKSKDKKDRKGKSDDDDDLAPSTAKVDSAVKTRTLAHNPKSDSRMEMPPASSKASISSPISFELKDVEITARKSILTVAIHNAGSKTFKISPDVISIAEGDKKISEAAMRAEFDSTSVKPDGEVKGKITIFGRPWNDRLTVSISDGSNNIQLKRNH